MEIKFSSKEIEAMILEAAQKLCPTLNYISDSGYRGIPDVTVSYSKPYDEPEPDELAELRKEIAELQQYITLMESPA